MRATGNIVDAVKFDNLAKVALGKQISFENEAKDAEPMIASQNEVVEKLKTGHRTMLDPTSEVSRFEEKVRHEEARVAGQSEIAASSLDAQFEDLESAGADAEIAARLAALKSPQDSDPPAELGGLRRTRTLQCPSSKETSEFAGL